VIQLHEQLAMLASNWRSNHFPCDSFPAIAEILEWAENPDGSGFVLRPPQLLALRIYWYLRLIEGTPHVRDLYERLFPNKAELLSALGIPSGAFEEVGYDFETLWKSLGSSDDFVREFKLQSLRETLSLEYPSYILALAMGAGKTALVGAIIASEFAMAMEYPDGHFIQNALVFAPGTTIIQSLRELVEIPYERVLPQRLHRAFAASIKIIFTRDGEKSIPVIRGSLFNVVVTNTEKIRIHKEAIRKSDIGAKLLLQREDSARAEIANARLQAIASLPHLGIFSDEAHHTYGQTLDKELKKVRKTVDYLSEHSPNLIVVVNTTGTPYYKKQLLRDVVVWYGLAQGIRDNILKEVDGNIQVFSFDDAQTPQLLDHVIEHFFAQYGDVQLLDGAPARLAIYFPQTDDLREYRSRIESKLAMLGLPASLVLENHSKASKQSIDAFNRLNDPAAPHRVILLVNKGTEGWNCPSLFACVLARKLRTSNNFVLQAASRCLRQVPGNRQKASIYLSTSNYAALDRQLQETYGETIDDFNGARTTSRRSIIRLRKLNLPPLVVRQLVRTVRRKEAASATLRLALPEPTASASFEKRVFRMAEQHATENVLAQVGETETLQSLEEYTDPRAAATELSCNYRVDFWAVLDNLSELYPTGKIPIRHLKELAAQIEEQTAIYEVREETVEIALALVKPEGFTREPRVDGTEVYTAEISYPVDRENLLLPWDKIRNEAGDFGFHYDPYDFDSNPEKSFFEQLLREIRTDPSNVQDVYFTGALTDPHKTDFYVEYLGEDEQWHRYTPDFVVRRKDGKCMIVEIKSAKLRAATEQDLENYAQGNAVVTIEGRKAVKVKEWETLNPDSLKYEILYAENIVGHDQLQTVRAFVGDSAHDE